MWKKFLLAFSLSFFVSLNWAAAAGFDITDIEGRQIHFDKQPKTFIVANYIANFLMVGGKDNLSKVTALTKDGLGRYALWRISSLYAFLSYLKRASQHRWIS